MNRVQLQDPVLQQACLQSSVRYQDLGLPRELTVWVDPGEVSCRSDCQQREPEFSTDDFCFATSCNRMSLSLTLGLKAAGSWRHVATTTD